MSQEGYDKLVAELRQLENEELPRVREAIAEARDKGDLSENFEYHAAKREQGRLLGRIRFKQRVLEHARVIDTTRLNSDNVGLLSKVKITNLASNASMSYTIVSPHEANMSEGKISIKSPIAQALMGHKAGDTVEVTVPAGKLRLRIDSVALRTGSNAPLAVCNRCQSQTETFPPPATPYYKCFPVPLQEFEQKTNEI